MSPSDRFLVLSHLVDELPVPLAPEIALTLVAVLAAAAFAVVRHMQGRATEAEARFAVDRARDLLREAAATRTEPRSN